MSGAGSCTLGPVGCWLGGEQSLGAPSLPPPPAPDSDGERRTHGRGHVWLCQHTLEKESPTSCLHLRRPGRTPDAPRGFCWWVLPCVRQPELEAADRVMPGGRHTAGRAEPQAERGLHAWRLAQARRVTARRRDTRLAACVPCFVIPPAKEKAPRHGRQRRAALGPHPPLPLQRALCARRLSILSSYSFSEAHFQQPPLPGGPSRCPS